MFAWLRKLYWKGEIPPKPCEKTLDWPDEEEWVFNYETWRWEAELKENPFSDGWEERWEAVEENAPVNLDDIPHAVIVEDKPSHVCCGGHCHIVQAPPVVSVVQTEPPPVLSVVETDVPKAPSQEPVIVSR